jgi:hypothetical protein
MFELELVLFLSTARMRLILGPLHLARALLRSRSPGMTSEGAGWVFGRTYPHLLSRRESVLSRFAGEVGVGA